jgi:hypothetical protein
VYLIYLVDLFPKHISNALFRLNVDIKLFSEVLRCWSKCKELPYAPDLLVVDKVHGTRFIEVKPVAKAANPEFRATFLKRACFYA